MADGDEAARRKEAAQPRQESRLVEIEPALIGRDRVETAVGEGWLFGRRLAEIDREAFLFRRLRAWAS